VRRAVVVATMLAVALLAATAATALTPAESPGGVPPRASSDAHLEVDLAQIDGPSHPGVPVVVRLGDQPALRAASHGPSPWDSAVLVAAILVALLGSTFLRSVSDERRRWSADRPCPSRGPPVGAAALPPRSRRCRPAVRRNDWSANHVPRRSRHRAGPAPLAR
jgi:hypothetical protein